MRSLQQIMRNQLDERYVMVEDLHPDLKGLPIGWQNAIVLHAMGHHLSNDEVGIELFIKWRDAGADADMDDIGLEPWEPFENYSQGDLYELVANMIYGLRSFLLGIGVVNMLDALQALTLSGEQTNKAFYVDGKQSALQKAFTGQSALLQKAREAMAIAKGE